MRIAIIGGGIGGLTAALSLRRAGLDAEVFEQAPELLDVGAAIAVWPNAMRALQSLGLGEEILRHAGAIEQVRWLDQHGRLLKEFALPRTDAPAVALHRADLQNALRGAFPAHLFHLGKTFESFELLPKGEGVVARFADGSSVTCELLIGADGLHSRVREQILRDGQPVYRGYTVWRGITPQTPAALPPLMAIEVYGRGQRFGIGPVGLGRTGWWATANEDEHAKAETAAERQAKLLDLFAGWYAPIRELIEGTPATTILRNPAYDRPPAEKWGEGRVTLLGDAAHPMTPNLGQGGCMAIEDGPVLAHCLVKYERQADALQGYERLRHRRTAAVTNYSLRYGRLGQWEGTAAVRLKGELIRMLPSALGQKLLRLLFDYDADSVPV
jgi:2-polyprenyl-6-methoxyphenol hydroxylase-like FAD-dependent oxidoreductase